MEGMLHSSTARFCSNRSLLLQCQKVCETGAGTGTKLTSLVTKQFRCLPRMIADVHAVVTGTNSKVHGRSVMRADLWGSPDCRCLSWKGQRGLVRGRAEQRKRKGGNKVTVRVVAMANQHQDLYETLGIGPSASNREIKQAYRRLALKFHPDVNKEADAQEKFLRIKNAYQMLSDPSSRSRYDVARRRGPGLGGEDWSPFGAWGTSGAKSKEDEEFYGFGEFFRDLENDLKRRQQEMAEGKTKSLWEELAELGEEFVEFLEKELEIPPLQQNPRGAAPENGSDHNKTSTVFDSTERAVAVDGDMVTVNYRCTTEDGQELFSSEEPISFVVGAGNVMGNPLFKGFDEASRGLAVGEQSSFMEKGSEWQEDLVFEVPRNHEEIVRLEKEASASEDGQLMQGSLVELSNSQPAVILEIQEDMVKIDANNPLAEVPLRFEVEVVSIDSNSDVLEFQKSSCKNDMFSRRYE